MRGEKVAVWACCLVLAMGLMLLSACGGGEEPDEDVLVTIPVTLYFINDEYVASGNEALPIVIGTEASISVKATENPYMALMDALREAPGEGVSTMITESIRFRDIYQSQEDKEMIVVDLYPEGLSSGSLGESLFIRQVVDTLLENGALIKAGAEDIKLTKVQFLVNGEITESLMGHFDASKPFTKEQPGE